jgi:hypothetical protein
MEVRRSKAASVRQDNQEADDLAKRLILSLVDKNIASILKAYLSKS